MVDPLAPLADNEFASEAVPKRATAMGAVKIAAN
jgi:hypothetical protein